MPLHGPVGARGARWRLSGYPEAPSAPARADGACSGGITGQAVFMKKYPPRANAAAKLASLTLNVRNDGGDSLIVVDVAKEVTSDNVGAGGPGHPVVDAMREQGLEPIPVSITSGKRVRRANGMVDVPKPASCRGRRIYTGGSNHGSVDGPGQGTRQFV